MDSNNNSDSSLPEISPFPPLGTPPVKSHKKNISLLPDIPADIFNTATISDDFGNLPKPGNVTRNRSRAVSYDNAHHNHTTAPPRRMPQARPPSGRFYNIAKKIQEINKSSRNLYEPAESPKINDPTVKFSPHDQMLGLYHEQSYESFDEEEPKVETPLVSKLKPKRTTGENSGTWFLSEFFAKLGRKVSVSNFLCFSFTFVMIPTISISLILFYHLGNPVIHFLPKGASLSWWLIFMNRQLVTLWLALLTQHFFVDKLALEHGLSVQLFGSLITLINIQAKGFPFILVFWGAYDLFFLHGPSKFSKNWLFFLDIDMLSSNNPDNGLLESDLYCRFLISMVVFGISTALKRTYVALYFGKRTFNHYKPQVENIMTEMLVLSEVAEFASSSSLMKTRWHINFSNTEKTATSKSMTPAESYNGESEDDEDDDDDDSVKDIVINEKIYLQNWKAPAKKIDKELDPSINDILQFRQALSYMDDIYPFTESFGKASTRDECVKSSKRLFKRLIRIQNSQFTSLSTKPKSNSFLLDFDVLSEICADEHGKVDDDEMYRALSAVFRADKNNKLSYSHFVQCTDSVFRKLYNIRASITNSSMMDLVLEDIMNTIFYFIMACIVMAILNFNPWGLLLSMTSVIVSFAFALGPSVSKYIEGIMLIAFRRPFELGDRIAILKVDDPDFVTFSNTWFVEDVTLYTTTLRYAKTNEISTVNNGGLANMRIVNCARSPGAIIQLNLDLCLKTSVAKLKSFRAAIEKYVADHPRHWAKVIRCWIVNIDADRGLFEYGIEIQHQKSWQEMSLVMQHKGSLHEYCTQLRAKMGIAFVSAHNSVDVYMKDDSVAKVAASARVLPISQSAKPL